MKEIKFKVRLGITMGDPAGIGPAIIPQAIYRLKDLAEFIIIGDKWVFRQSGGFGSRIAVSGFRKIKFIDLDNVGHKDFSFGKVRADFGRASIEYLDKALEMLKNDRLDCLVTCPVSKEAVNLGGFGFKGHTEYLASKTNTKNFAMMLLNRKLKITLATRHIPLRKVPSELTPEKIAQATRFTYKALQQLFSIKNPRIVICAVNPHASDNGLIGDEENRIIKPAVEKLKLIIPALSGPQPADAAIAKALGGKYDGVIAMYHDQALIALKALDASSGVNLTLGLPFVRTSPLHGTAFDIAGKSGADPASLIAAIKLAARCTLNLKKA